jgi:dienelactone hydrolase
MVVCNPFGYEAICAHRSLRRFAEEAAALGIPSLHFDYDGTGDSYGEELEPARVRSWTLGIHHAIAQLQAACGIERVIILGLRLGATLATLAAAERSDVAGIIALAPIVTGKSYLRELRALQMAMALAPPAAQPSPSSPPAAQGAPAAPSAAPPDDVQESVGFALSGEARRELGTIDLTRSTRRPAPHVLVLDRDDLVPNRAWVEALAALGATVEHRPLPGYPEMVLDPHKARPPEAMLAAAGTWLRQRLEQPPGPGPGRGPGPAPANDTGPVPVLLTSASRPATSTPASRSWGASSVRPPAREVLARSNAGAPTVLEEAAFIDSGSILFGMISRPAPSSIAPGSDGSTPRSDHGLPGPRRGRPGVLLLNAGAIHHIGPNRLYVTLARAWAAEGHTVLRLDLSGLGDSVTRPGQPDNVVYGQQAAADVSTAVHYLRALPDVSGVIIVGLCSGAYHGFKAAVAGDPVSAVVPINPLTFFWKKGMSLDFPAHKVAGESHRYARSALRLESWKKLARGEVDLRALSQVMARRLLSLIGRRWRDLARPLGIPLADDLGGELEAVAARGVALDFVFAEGDPGIELLALQGGRVVPPLVAENQLRTHVIVGPDHTFTARWSHPVLIERLTTVIRSHRDG